jgi:phenylacetate-coenzyme A ligase PaaK-like adenylate-forming protein
VFETGIRQFRMAMAMVSGRRIRPEVIEQLIADAAATLAEFGAPGDDVRQLLEGPFADPEAREHFQTQGIRRTLRRLDGHSPFYRRRLGEAGISEHDIKDFEPAALHRIPVTTKAELVRFAGEFVCDDVRPHLSTRTTGTTGKPVEIWLSVYESRLWPALAALAGLLRHEINPDDLLQVNLSSRATAAVQHDIEVCRLVGARTRVLGLVPVDQSLDALLDGATILGTYPSYLAQLVTEARARGLSARDFGLRRIDVAGELLSAGVADAAREMFGAEVTDTFAMTEVLPLSGRSCERGHLHPDMNVGLVEVVRLDEDVAADPGELGRLVVTPYFPYRDCMPLLRYDTGDLVRRLPDDAPRCSLAGIPGVSAIQGKASLLVHTADGPVTTRDVLEVLEGLPTHPWPARFSSWADDSGRLQVCVPRAILDDLGSDQAGLEKEFADRGIDCAVVLAAPDSVPHAVRAVRADLTETTFPGAPQAPLRPLERHHV